MFAVIATGGKQYTVRPGDTLRVERLECEVGTQTVIKEVLTCGQGGSVSVGQPYVEGAEVIADIVTHNRARKVIIFKKRRRKNSRRKNGHRQHYTLLKIVDIKVAGQSLLAANN